MLKAGGKIVAGAVQSYLTDKVTGCVVSKGGQLLAGASKATVRTLGQYVSKNTDNLLAAPGMVHDYLEPALDVTH